MSKKRKRLQAAAAAQSRPEEAAPSRFVTLRLVGILLLAAALRVWHIDSPIGGFHGFNEANYILIAKNFFGSSFLRPTPDGRYLFLETPPLFAYLLHGVFRVVGISILAARIVSVACSLLLVVTTFFLGRSLLGVGPALTGALFIAVSPLSVLTGRNVQTDSLCVALVCWALYLWWRAEAAGARRDRLLAGLFFGLALFTKLFALVALAAALIWQTVSRRGFGWTRDRTIWEAGGIAAALPALFYGYHAAHDLAYVRRDVTGGAAVATGFPSHLAEWSALGLEAFWAFSPLLAFLGIAGLARALATRSSATTLLSVELLVFLLFYLLVHKHSYYLLTLLPFGALLTGNVIQSFRPWLRVSTLALATSAAVFLSLVDLTSMKLGFREFAELQRQARSLPSGRRVYLVQSEFRDNAGPIVSLYDPAATVGVLEETSADEKGGLRLPAGDAYLLRFVPPQAPPPPVGWLFERQRLGLTLFGWTVAEVHPNPHFFREGRYLALRTGGLFDFGTTPLKVYPALAMLPLPPGMVLYRTPEGISLNAPGTPQR